MIIIGHPAITYSPFVKVSTIADISHVPHTCVVWFDGGGQKNGFELAAHCHNNEVNYAVMIHSIEELLIYANLAPQYLILSARHKPKAYQRIIEHYLLDCKLLCVIKSSAQLPKIAQLGIDGVIFKQVLDSM